MAASAPLSAATSGSWAPTRLENGADPLPGIVAVRYADALSRAEGDYRQGRTDEAIEQLTLAADLAPRRAFPHILVAEIHADAGLWQEADAAYARALAVEPRNDVARAGRARARVAAARPAPVAVRTAPAAVVAGAGQPRGEPLAAGRPALQPQVRLRTGEAFLVLVPYLVALALAEVAVTFLNPVLVFPLHGGILAIATVHIVLLDQRVRTDPKALYLSALLLTLMLSPLIRVISLTLPLAQIEASYRFLFAGVPMVIGALLVARYVGLRPSWIGLTWRGEAWQLIAVELSVVFGFVEYLILRPEPLGSLPWTAAGFLPALTVAVATGFPEELIFRGMMQTVARPLIGSRWTIIYVSLVFAVLHIGYQSFIDFGFVLAVGLFYGWIFERSRSIVGVSIGHGLANAILFFVAPNLFGA